jgi:hypothetical protein
MHNVTMRKRESNKIVVPIVRNRLNPQLVMAMRKNRSNVLNPDKRRRSRVNEKASLYRMGA